MDDAPFDAEGFLAATASWGHGGWAGVRYLAQGPDWAELELPFADRLIGDEERGVVASGAIFTLMDIATSCAIWLRLGRFAPQATLDMRLDYLRPATPGAAVIGRGECYRVTRHIAFVRGIAHDGDAANPVAHAAGTYMFTGAPAR